MAALLLQSVNQVLYKPKIVLVVASKASSVRPATWKTLKIHWIAKLIKACPAKHAFAWVRQQNTGIHAAAREWKPHAFRIRWIVLPLRVVAGRFQLRLRMAKPVWRVPRLKMRVHPVEMQLSASAGLRAVSLWWGPMERAKRYPFKRAHRAWSHCQSAIVANRERRREITAATPPLLPRWLQDAPTAARNASLWAFMIVYVK